MKVKDIIPLYLNHLKAMGRSERTVTGARYDLHRFERFLEEEGILDLEDLTSDAMYDYQQSLAFSLTAKGTLMTLRTQAQLLGAAKGFTRFLKKMDYLIYDPGEKIKAAEEAQDPAPLHPDSIGYPKAFKRAGHANPRRLQKPHHP